MDDIASSMGISKRTIYEIFRDKNSLVEACVHHFYERGNHDLEQLLNSADSVFNAFVSFTQSTSQVVLQLHYNFFREIQKYFPDVFTSTVQRYRELHRRNTKNLLLRGQQEGLFEKSVDADRVAVLITTVTSAIQTSNMFEELGYDSRKMTGDLVYNYMCGISTPKGLKMMKRLHEMYNSANIFLLNKMSHPSKGEAAAQQQNEQPQTAKQLNKNNKKYK
jgi:AcrR family transcriptional regulator